MKVFHEREGLCIFDDAPKTVLIEHELSSAKLIHTFQNFVESENWNDGWDVLFVDTGKGEPIVLTPNPEALQLSDSEKRRLRKCVDLFSLSKASVLEDAIKDKLILDLYLQYFSVDYFLDLIGLKETCAHWIDWE